MGKLILKNIRCTLDPASLKRAAKEIEDLANGLVSGLAELARQLMERGVDIAKMYISNLGAVDTGALMASIGHGAYDVEEHKGVIYVGGYYAFFVEFGTGVVGKMSSHPAIGEIGSDIAVLGANGSVYTGYDTNGHGEKGWYYKDGKGWHWTKGMPARPFMYNTFRELERVAAEEGGRIIAEYIP